MNFLNSVRNVFTRKPSTRTFERRPGGGTRSIAAAMTGVGTQGIIKIETSIDEVLRGCLSKLRNMSRGMAQNNGLVRNYLRRVEEHVVSPQGVDFQSRARVANGDLNREANRIIDEAFETWSKAKNCDVRKKANFHGLQRLVMRTVVRDGECFVRKIKNHAGSAHRFALQILPTEMVDETLWDTRKNLRCGIEFDEWGAPVAYYLRQDRATHFTIPGANNRHYIRVPADEMIHVFVEEFPDQSRGIPWICSAIIKLEQLLGYEEAELMAARVGALKGGFLTSPDGDGKALADGEDAAGNLISELTPGAVEVLPAGYSFQGFDPTHPGGNFGPFTNKVERGISSALGVSYNLLCNDLVGVNLSSLRVGRTEEKEFWKSLQKFFKDEFLDKIPEDWANYASLVGALDPIRPSMVEKLICPGWRFRGWDWDDPLKEADAAVTSLKGNLTTHTRVLAAKGIDFNDFLQERYEERKMAAEYEIDLDDFGDAKPIPAPAPNPARDPDSGDEKDDETDPADEDETELEA